MASSTKRHPARIRIKSGCDASGKLIAIETQADFDTGAYASWGPTVATRVPIHASGPYFVPHVTARGRAYFTHCHPSGAFRGFGVPQGAIAHEAMMDELADKLGMDRLAFRRLNALKAGDATATGQVLAHSAGLPQCLDALKPHWEKALADCAAHNRTSGTQRRGAGIGCMWYGIGNTSLSNPSTMRIGLSAKGELTLYNGAVDIGQGSNTILTQIAADALGLPMGQFRIVMGDTDLTADAGKTSASRQTFVSGKAAELAGRDLRRKLIELLETSPDAVLSLEGSVIKARDAKGEHQYDLAWLPATPRDRRAARRRHIRSAHEPAGCRRPGRALCHLCIRRADGGGRSGLRPRHGEGARHRRRARRRQGHQSDPGRGADPGRHHPGPGPGIDGRIPAGQDREPARLPDPRP